MPRNLQGEINVNEMAAQAKAYLRAYNSECDTFQTGSLDRFIPGTKTTYLDALVAEIAAEGITACASWA